MSLLINIVAAEEEELEAVGLSDHPVEEWTGLEMRDFGIGKLAALHCLLSGEDYEEALAAYEPVFDAVEDDGALVVRVPDEIAQRLAELDEETLEQVGEELAASEDFELEGWPVGEVQTLVVGLGDLARLADTQGQVIYVWMTPLAS